MMDVHGSKVASADFKNCYSFVQFGSLRLKSDQALLLEIESGYRDIMKVLMILDDPTISEKWISNRLIKFVSDRESRMRKLFDVPMAGSYFLVYDPRGILIGSGSVQVGFNRGLKGFLDRRIKNIGFVQEMMIPQLGVSTGEYNWLRQVDHIISSHSHEYYLIGMFSSICGGCLSGLLINMMKDIHAHADDGLGVWCILSPDFTADDVSGLITQLSISFPVEKADNLLGKKWEELSITYSLNEVNEIIFVVDKSGVVIDRLDRYAQESQKEFVYRCLQRSIKRNAYE